MWTVDVIKALSLIEERIGYPVCIKSVYVPIYSSGNIIRIEMTDMTTFYTYYVNTGELKVEKLSEY